MTASSTSATATTPASRSTTSRAISSATSKCRGSPTPRRPTARSSSSAAPRSRSIFRRIRRRHTCSSSTRTIPRSKSSSASPARLVRQLRQHRQATRPARPAARHRGRLQGQCLRGRKPRPPRAQVPGGAVVPQGGHGAVPTLTAQPWARFASPTQRPLPRAARTCHCSSGELVRSWKPTWSASRRGAAINGRPSALISISRYKVDH